MTRILTISLGVIAAVGCVAWLYHNHREQERCLAEARAQVSRWADELSGQTTDAGIFVRHPGNQLPESDPWETPLSVAYTQGGFAETLTVRSAGPDRLFNTEDDVVEKRYAVNLKGVGKGMRDHVEEFAENGARGMTKGVIGGIREGVQKAIQKKPRE
jgi:hypothetical protein